MKTSKEYVDNEIKRLNKKVDALMNRVLEIEEPILVPLLGEVKVKFIQTHNKINHSDGWTEYIELEEPYITEGIAKVIESNIKERYDDVYHPGWKTSKGRTYRLIIKTSDGEHFRTVLQNEFKEAIENARK